MIQISDFKRMFSAGKEDMPPTVLAEDETEDELSSHESHDKPHQDFATMEVDELGQHNEALRQGIQNIATRLAEIDAIRSSFGSLSEPLLSVIDELPVIRFQLADASSHLEAEKETVLKLRQQNSDLSSQIGTLNDEVSAHRARIANFEEEVGHLQLALGQLRIEHEKSAQAAAESTKLLAVEAEKSRALTEDNQLLRYEAENSDHALARGERERSELAGRTRLLEQDYEIVQKAHEALLDRQSLVDGRLADAIQRVESLRQANAELEAKINTERGLRERVERQRETERAAYASQVGALEMRVEGFTARVAINENILSNTRDQLREANDAVRLAERHAKEALIDRNSFERRVVALEAEAEKEALQTLAFEQRLADINEQNAQLTKAVAEKQLLREQADIRHSGVSERLEEFSRRLLSERTQAELSQQNLLRELTQERSERKLIQGALDTARAQRDSLFAELQALRKASHPAELNVARPEPQNVAAEPKTPQMTEIAPAANGGNAPPVHVMLQGSAVPTDDVVPIYKAAKQAGEAHPLLL